MDTIEKVLEQIKIDVKNNNMQAIEELLKFLPLENLINYLPRD